MTVEVELQPSERLHAELIHEAGGFADAVLPDLSLERIVALDARVARISRLLGRLKGPFEVGNG
jgi:hypothetical protein